MKTAIKKCSARMKSAINFIGLFINKEYNFFVEGKHQLGYSFNNYGEKCIDKDALINIIESSIIYSLEFDLLTPPIEAIQEIGVFVFFRYVSILRKHPPYHVFCYVFVVFNLRLVTIQKNSCDLVGRSRPSVLQKFDQHHGLINMGHPHLVTDEFLKYVVWPHSGSTLLPTSH